MKPIRLLQLSDCHITPTKGDLFRGVDPRQTLSTLVQHIQHLPIQFDHLLLTGDLVHHGDASIYQELLDLVAPLQLPTHWIAGNHDDLEVMNQAAPELFQPVLDWGVWQLLSLDSNDSPDGRGSGSLSQNTLDLLKRQLYQQSKHTLVALHHNPLASGTAWQDDIMLANANAFWSVIERQSSCKAVICGHLHQALAWQNQQTHVWSAPSTAAQFCPDTDSVQIEVKQPDAWPGFRWYQLWPDGRVDAHLERVDPDC